jgi:hypothetical protein
MPKLAEGTKVNFHLTGDLFGLAVVRGIALEPQIVIGYTYILEDLSGKLPNDAYPYKFFVCTENMFKPECYVEDGKEAKKG